MGGVRDFFRYMKASGRYGRGTRHLRRAEYHQARDTFLDAVRIAGEVQPTGMNVGPWFSIRLSALCDLAICAAQMNDTRLARSSIQDALALWETMSIGPASKFKGMPDWIAWARDYLTRSSNGEVH